MALYFSKLTDSLGDLTKKPSTKKAPSDILAILPPACAPLTPDAPVELTEFALTEEDSIVVTVSPSEKLLAPNKLNINVGCSVAVASSTLITLP